MKLHVSHHLSSTVRILRFPGDSLCAQGSGSFTRPLSRGLLSTRSRDLAVRMMSSTNQTESASEYESFFRYTSGRWVWDEEQQLRDRYKFFNVTELQNVAAKVVGSESCVSMIKLAEGGYRFSVFSWMMARLS
ncbi:hypothetical protein V1525DRAFT_410510 [Lipomyces kononenkoae]|uniref:Uncharacterized protein n=1 Tax=Lipomyces kononenkoae TaxID=34357 RepID=A0ACC3SUE2_LIPKO